tara:strand:- start:3134 stop:4057 length:924 start_codon:yes stop_codon:yes gene_type:complete
LGKIFDSHPNVVYRHEPDSLVVNADIPFTPYAEDCANYETAARQYLQKIKHVRQTKSAGSLPQFDKNFYRPLGFYFRKFYAFILKSLQSIPGLSFLRSASLPDMIASAKKDQVKYVLKSVNTISRTYLYSKALPDAKVVHIVRHPCGYVASQLKGRALNLMGDEFYAHSLSEMQEAKRRGLTLEKLKTLSIEEQIVCSWMLHNEKTMQEIKDQPNCITLVYEDLCRAPIEKTRELFSFCDLDWNEQTNNFLEQSLNYQGQNEKYFQVVRDPVKAAYKWKDSLKPEQISRIQEFVKDSLPGQLYANDF